MTPEIHGPSERIEEIRHELAKHHDTKSLEAFNEIFPPNATAEHNAKLAQQQAPEQHGVMGDLQRLDTAFQPGLSNIANFVDGQHAHLRAEVEKKEHDGEISHSDAQKLMSEPDALAKKDLNTAAESTQEAKAEKQVDDFMQEIKAEDAALDTELEKEFKAEQSSGAAQSEATFHAPAPDAANNPDSTPSFEGNTSEPAPHDHGDTTAGHSESDHNSQQRNEAPSNQSAAPESAEHPNLSGQQTPTTPDPSITNNPSVGTELTHDATPTPTPSFKSSASAPLDATSAMQSYASPDPQASGLNNSLAMDPSADVACPQIGGSTPVLNAMQTGDAAKAATDNLSTSTVPSLGGSLGGMGG